jgi:hypothetical protein
MFSLIMLRVGGILFWILVLLTIIERNLFYLLYAVAVLLGAAAFSEAADDYRLKKQADKIAKQIKAVKQ